MYTLDTPYEEEVKELGESCDKFGIDYKFYSIKNLHDWVKNTQQKADVIHAALEDFTCDLLWLDADAVILKSLPLFDQLADDDSFHICIHRAGYSKNNETSLRNKISNFFKHRRHPNGEIMSGTIYIKNCYATKQLIKKWRYLNKQMVKWDQRTLQTIIDKPNATYIAKQLPPEYVKIVPKGQVIDDVDDGANFIGHKQASRHLRSQISSK